LERPDGCVIGTVLNEHARCVHVFIVFSHLLHHSIPVASCQEDEPSQLPEQSSIDKSPAETPTAWDGYAAVDQDEGDDEWTPEEWRIWNELGWDGFETKDEPEDEIPDPEEEPGVANPVHDEFEDVEVDKPPEPSEPPPKKPRSHGDDDSGYYSGQWNDSSWWDGPWKWNQWGWKDNQQQWSPRAWQGKSSSSRSHSNKAPWAFTNKGKKGKGKSKGKAKQDRWGGTYVKGGYTSPDGTFYQYLDDLIGIPLDLDFVTDFHVFGVEVAY